MVAALNANVPLSGKTVLEIGADPWFLSCKAMKRYGAATIITSDLNDVWSGAAEDGVAKVLIDARDICAVLPPRSVDIVYGINILEHLPEIPSIMRSIYDVLRPGGIAYLHGHPLWTSSRGHHALLGTPEHWQINFSGTGSENPVPLWGHLTHDRKEMRQVLDGLPQSVIDAALYWCFDAEELNRTPRRKILEDLRSGPMTMTNFWEDRLEHPGPEIIERLKASPWWDDQEDYASRGLTAVLIKS